MTHQAIMPFPCFETWITVIATLHQTQVHWYQQKHEKNMSKVTHYRIDVLTIIFHHIFLYIKINVSSISRIVLSCQKLSFILSQPSPVHQTSDLEDKSQPTDSNKWANPILTLPAFQESPSPCGPIMWCSWRKLNVWLSAHQGASK